MTMARAVGGGEPLTDPGLEVVPALVGGVRLPRQSVRFARLKELLASRVRIEGNSAKVRRCLGDGEPARLSSKLLLGSG